MAITNLGFPNGENGNLFQFMGLSSLGYANNQILPIEGSIYETKYADGTPIE